MEPVSGSSEDGSVAVTNRPTDNKEVPDPSYISYLFNRRTKHNFFFLVGDPSYGEVEKIGVVKLKLVAHSEPFRMMLEESELAETGLVKIPDIQPNTFRHLLRFMYGYNNVPSLTLEEALDLVYAAEKYLVDELKDRLATHIASLLTVDNVFQALQKPECFQLEELKNAILKIVQYETKSLVSKDEFLTLNNFAVQTILEQNALAVPEIDMWRVLYRWAKHNALSDEAVELRGKLGRHMKFIRFCALASDDFAKEVVVTDILSEHEVFHIIRAIGSNTKQEDLTTVCNKIEPRNLLRSFIESPRSIALSGSKYDGYTSSSYLFILTKDHPLLLTSALCNSNKHQWDCINKGLQYKCNCEILITKITDCDHNTSTEPPVKFVFEDFVEYGKTFIIPFRVGEENVKLLANTLYKIAFEFSDKGLYSWYSEPDRKHVNDDLTIVLESSSGYSGTYCSHMKQLDYKTITEIKS